MLMCLIALGIEPDLAGVSGAFVTSVASRGNSCIATDPRHPPPMLATAIQIAAAAGLGGMAGLLGGLFGVGGGFLVIPLLGFFYGMDQQTAQGTALIMVVPNVLWAFSQYQRRFGVDLRMATAIAGSALIAAYPTARFTTGLDPHVLRLAFAVFLATTAGAVAYRTWRGGARVGRGRRRAWGWVTVVESLAVWSQGSSESVGRLSLLRY